MGEPFLAEIRVVAFNFAPRGWAFCNGQTLPINQNQALFSLLGTTYGGNGVTTFALPNFQGRVPVHFGNGISLGQAAGEENHTLTIAEMPSHTHIASASSNPADAASPTNNVSAKSVQPAYAATPNAPLHPSSVAAAGSGHPHLNMSPFLVLNFVIALQGIFPSRN
jgi:microcystin-dependent protein